MKLVPVKNLPKKFIRNNVILLLEEFMAMEDVDVVKVEGSESYDSPRSCAGTFSTRAKKWVSELKRELLTEKFILSKKNYKVIKRL